MKLKKEFITHINGEDNLIVSSGNAPFAGVIKGNETAGRIFECLKEETTEEQIVAALQEEFDAPQELITENVKSIIDKLRKLGAIEE